MTVSVVIPCLNASMHVGQALEGLADQVLDEPWEVVIVDNGSTDDTFTIAEGFADRVSLKLVRATAVAGQWYARNIGVAAARGDSVVFLDADDVPAPGYLAAMRDTLRDADLAAGSLETGRLNPGWIRRSREMGLVDGLTTSMGFLPFAITACLAIRKGAFESLGGFRRWPAGVPGEDAELCWRAQMSGMTIRAAPDAVLHYRYRDTLGGIARQSVGYGVAQARLYRRFRSQGMPREGIAETARRWRDLAGRAWRARDKGEVAECVFLFGVYSGRFYGSLRHGVVYP